MDENESGYVTTVADRVARRVVVLGVMGALTLLLLWLASRPVRDPDTWWHLRLGQDLSERGLRWASVPHWSPFATADWAPNGALADIILARVEDWFGLPGVAWVFGFGLLVMLWAAYLACRSVATDLPAVFATAMLVLGVSGSISPRPQILSYVLLSVVVCVWLRTESDRAPRWWLVPLTWIWAMWHGYWLIGVLVGLTFAGGMALRTRFTGGRLVTREALRLMSVPLLSLLAAMLTPVGPELALGFSRVSERNQFVQEAQRTAFDRAQPWLVLVMIVTVALVWLVTRREVSIARVGLLVMSTGWLLITERTVAVAAILIAPLFASAIQTLISQGRAEVPRVSRRTSLAFAGFAGLGLSALALVVPNTADKPGGVPTAFDSRLRGAPEHSIILNEYTIGGWLALEYPQLDVVVDPLCDAYSIEHLASFRDMKHARGEWREFVASTEADLAVLKSKDPISGALEDAGWKVEAADGPFVLMTPPAG